MPRRYVTADEQRQVIERANRRCEYCKSSMDYTTQAFVMEHIIPISKGGQTALDNLALAFGGCNGHKHIKVEGFDSASKTNVPLFHPRRQIWEEHFGWSADFLQMIGLTKSGRATVHTLNLNRSGVVNIRRLLLLAGCHPP